MSSLRMQGSKNIPIREDSERESVKVIPRVLDSCIRRNDKTKERNEKTTERNEKTKKENGNAIKMSSLRMQGSKNIPIRKDSERESAKVIPRVLDSCIRRNDKTNKRNEKTTERNEKMKEIPINRI